MVVPDAATPPPGVPEGVSAGVPAGVPGGAAGPRARLRGAVRRLRRPTVAGQLLSLQLGILVFVLVGVGAVSLAQAQLAFERDEGDRLLRFAEWVAANPLTRPDPVSQVSPLAAVDAEQRLAPLAVTAATWSSATDVIIARPDRRILTSLDPSLVGTPLELGASPVLAGRSWTGHLRLGGEEVLAAHAPVLWDSGRVSGVVAVTQVRPTILERLLGASSYLLTYLGLAGVGGLLGSWLLARRLKRQTLGLEPTEIAGLFEHREAMLHAIREGVLVLDPGGRIALANDSAAELLGLPGDPVGCTLAEIGVGGRLHEVLLGTVDGKDAVVVVNGRVLVLNRRAVRARGRSIGSVTTLRDRTDLTALRRQVGEFRSTAELLRAQTHEFANQLHTISGLIQLGEHDEVVGYIEALTRHRDRLDRDLPDRIADPVVSSLIGAKSSVAAERMVQLRVTSAARLGRLDADTAADVATVLGNLIDNALDVVRYGQGWVEVDLRDDDETVEVTVRDNGPGVPTALVGEVFRHGFSTKVALEGGERGIGLALSRQICRRRGGELTVVNTDDGAQFTARLPAGRTAPTEA